METLRTFYIYNNISYELNIIDEQCEFLVATKEDNAEVPSLPVKWIIPDIENLSYIAIENVMLFSSENNAELVHIDKNEIAHWMQYIRNAVIYNQLCKPKANIQDNSNVEQNNKTMFPPSYVNSYHKTFRDQTYIELPHIDNENLQTYRRFASKVAFAFHSPSVYGEFLQFGIRNTILKRLKFMDLEDHPLFQNIKRIHIGNAFCWNLYPNNDIILRLLNKASEENIEATIVMPPTREAHTDQVLELISFLEDYCCKTKLTMEIVCNDWGLFAKLTSIKCFFVVIGRMMNKANKDPRYIARDKKSTVNCYNANFFIDFLKQQNITDIEADYFSEQLQLTTLRTHLYLPVYYLTISEYCPLCAQFEHGDLHKQSPSENCNQLCQTVAFLFPKNMNAFGIGNCCFGIDSTLLYDPSFLVKNDDKIRRIVYYDINGGI